MNEKVVYDLEIVKYGLKVVVYNAITIGLIMLISYELNYFAYSCYFLIPFCYLRITFGGYHCKTYVRCLLTTNILFLITLACSNVSYYYNFVCSIFLPMNTFFIYHANHKYRFKLLFFMIFGLLLLLLNNFDAFIAWSSGMFLSQILFIINKIDIHSV